MGSLFPSNMKSRWVPCHSAENHASASCFPQRSITLFSRSGFHSLLSHDLFLTIQLPLASVFTIQLPLASLSCHEGHSNPPHIHSPSWAHGHLGVQSRGANSMTALARLPSVLCLSHHSLMFNMTIECSTIGAATDCFMDGVP